MAYGDYPDLSSIRRVLVIKLRHHGDVLLSSPVFGVLERHLPQAEIRAYLYKDTLPMLETHTGISGFHLYDRSWKSLSLASRILNETNLIREIRSMKYDLVINLTEGDRGALAARFSGAKYRVGWDPAGSGIKGKHKIYTHLVKKSRLPRHIVEQNLDAIRRIGIFPEVEERQLSFNIPTGARQHIGQMLSQADIRGKFILIHPTSRWMFKSWPAKSFGALIRLLNQAGYTIVVSAGPDPREMEMVQAIKHEIIDVPFLNLAGQLNLHTLAALIDASHFFVGVDSVPMHIASALRKPSIALFGPSSDDVWGPWQNPWGEVVSTQVSCRPCNLDGCGGGKVSDCLVQISVDRVFKRVIALLESISG